MKKCINLDCGYEPNGRGWLLSNPVKCPNCHTPQADEIDMTTKQNYVDSRTPEECEADSKIETIMTTATDMTKHPEKEPCEWEEEWNEKSKSLFTRGGLYTLLDYPPHDWVLDETAVKSFIRSLLTSAREEEQRNCDEITALARRGERERIKEIIRKERDSWGKSREGYRALADLSDNIK